MSSISKVRNSVSELTAFMKEKCVLNLREASTRGDFTIDDVSLQRIVNIVDMSVSQAFSLGFQNVESALRDYENSVKKSNKKR